MKTKTWRFSGPSISGEGWWVAFIDEAGCLAVLSDFGDYSFRWNLRGIGEPNLVRFLVKCDSPYVLNKLARRDWFDADFAEKQVRDALRERDGEDAAQPSISNEFDLHEAVVEHALYQQAADGDLTRMDFDPQAKAFIERVWPRIVKELKEAIGRGDA